MLFSNKYILPLNNDKAIKIPADKFKQPSMPKFDPRFMPAGVKIEEIKEEPAKAKVEEPVKVEEVKAEEPVKVEEPAKQE